MKCTACGSSSLVARTIVTSADGSTPGFKQIRLKLKLSQGEIAALLGIENRAQISAYENGKRDAPVIVLLRYARLAKIPLETIVDDQLSLPK